MSKEIITELEQLSGRCDEIDVRKENNLAREITVELKNTLREHPEGVALSANQIGYNKRIFVIKFKNELKTFINPIIAQAEGLTINREGCLSIPGKEYLRPRNTKIGVIYQTPLGKTESCKLAGMSAMVFQHELDHLDGLTLADVGLELDENFDKATEEEKEEIIKMYMDSLDMKEKEIKKEIEEDKDLKQQYDAINFMTAVQQGKVQFEKVDKKDE